jgi:putative transcriptional regulator
MTTLGKRLIKAAQEASAIARGEANPSTYRVHVPASIDVKAVRHKLHMTQAEFSARFAVPLSTLKDWEQHRRTPEGQVACCSRSSIAPQKPWSAP